MKIKCIKGGKCMTEGSGFIEVREGNTGEIIEKDHKGHLIAFINGTRVIVHRDHIDQPIDNKNIFACFETINSLEESKILILKRMLESYSGKKVIFN